MIDFAKHRAKLAAKLATIKQMRLEPEVQEDGCVHEWQKFKETIQAKERTYEQMNAGMEYKASDAYFVVLACSKCREKKRIDYVVER